MNFWQEDLNKSKQFEVWLSQEKKEEFDKNLNEFNSKYSKKLENVLPEDILKKVSGSFESSWNIENTISNLKNDWLSEKNIESLKKYLIENKELSSEDLKNIKEEFENFKDNKNLDLKLWNLIWKAVKEAEKNDNDELFSKIKEFKNIQQNWNLEEKQNLLSELEWNFSEENKKENIQFEEKINKVDNVFQWNSQNNEKNNDIEFDSNTVLEKKEEVKDNKNQKIQEKKENWVDDVDVWNEEGYFENWLIIWDTFSKDKWWESNDYWNENNYLTKEDLEQNNWENQKKIFSDLNWEYSPILEDLKSKWEINNEDFEKFQKDLASTPSDKKQDKFLNIIEKLPNSENKENLLNKFKNQENVTEENFEKTQMFQDSKWKIDFDKSVWWLETMVAKNYVFTWSKEKSEDQNKIESLNTALEVSKSKIVNSKSKDFKNNNAELISEITKETNLDKKYQKLKELYKEGLKEDAKAGWKKWTEEIESRKNNLKWEYKKILEEISKNQKNWNEQELEKLNKQKQKIEDEAKDISKLQEELDQIIKETDLDFKPREKQE